MRSIFTFLFQKVCGQYVEVLLIFMCLFCPCNFIEFLDWLWTVLIKSLEFAVYKIMSSANRALHLPFQFWCHLLLLLAWLLYWRLPVLYWVRMVRVSTPVLFLILEEKLSSFHHYVSYGLLINGLHYVKICPFCT